MHMRPLRLAVSLFALVACGCVSSNFMRVGGTSYPPRPDDYIIEVFVPLNAPVEVHQSVANAKSTSDLPASAKIIGRIDTNGAPAAAWSAVVNDAKKKARALGGDAIVINQWGSPLAAVDGYGQAYHGKAISMNVLRFSE